MKKCVKCGHIVNNRVSYCPNCGTLLPQEKERKLIATSEIQRLKRTTAGMVVYDKKEYEDAVNFYKSHLTMGYAPNGKVIVEQAEYDRLKKAEAEFEQNKRKYGTNIIYSSLNGTFFCIPNYGVGKHTINRTVDISFGDYWKELYDKQDKWTRIAIQGYCWLMFASCFILLCAIQNTLYILVSILVMAIIFIWIAVSIFDYD